MSSVTFVLALLGLAALVYGGFKLYKKHGPKGSTSGTPGGGGGGPSKR